MLDLFAATAITAADLQVGRSLRDEIALNLYKGAISPFAIALRCAATAGGRDRVRKAFDAGPRLAAAADFASQTQHQHAMEGSGWRSMGIRNAGGADLLLVNRT
jgi:hypothetical protein